MDKQRGAFTTHPRCVALCPVASARRSPVLDARRPGQPARWVVGKEGANQEGS